MRDVEVAGALERHGHLLSVLFSHATMDAWKRRCRCSDVMLDADFFHSFALASGRSSRARRGLVIDRARGAPGMHNASPTLSGGTPVFILHFGRRVCDRLHCEGFSARRNSALRSSSGRGRGLIERVTCWPTTPSGKRPTSRQCRAGSTANSAGRTKIRDPARAPARTTAADAAHLCHGGPNESPSAAGYVLICRVHAHARK